MIILREVSLMEKDKISHDITSMWNLKYDTNELIYKTKTESCTLRTNWWLLTENGLGEKWRRRLGLADISFYI